MIRSQSITGVINHGRCRSALMVLQWTNEGVSDPARLYECLALVNRSAVARTVQQLSVAIAHFADYLQFDIVQTAGLKPLAVNWVFKGRGLKLAGMGMLGNER